ncbi:MAG: glutamate--tRNA ligase, partial [Firmicutes bacterium]|nr:glutamate--tRNA ligase [Bacillota bacterium]
MSVRVRFAPSPTGYLHIGNVHTALFSWLFARHNGGRFVLRIEDTDVDRSEARYEAAILDELRWLGLDWDEGVDKGGPYGPYRQSERLELYAQYAQRLLDTGHAYWCYCTREEIEAQRDAALRAGRAPRYNGHCRRLSEAERRRREQAGIKPVLRFRVPDTGGDIVVEDLIRGPIRFSLADLDDFVLVRSNGVPLYNLAVTVDDLTMRITHIIRAEEHLSNTPRQILIYQALGEAPPVFAHVSMLLGPDRTKLSKRHGAASISEFRGQGYLPEAILNYLALLGWTPPGGQEILSVPEIIRQFDLGRVSHSPAVFDVN